MSRNVNMNGWIVASFRCLAVCVINTFKCQQSWWRHQMETFPRHWPFVRGINRLPVNSPHKGQWRGALMFSLICTQINGWANNGDAGDLGHHLAHYDVIIMFRKDPIGHLEKCLINKMELEIYVIEQYMLITHGMHHNTLNGANFRNQLIFLTTPVAKRQNRDWRKKTY